MFISSKCPVNTCKITANREQTNQADLVLYKDHFIPTGMMRPPKQLYMLYFLECPYHTQHIKFPNVFNWTSTYRFVWNLNIILFAFKDLIFLLYAFSGKTAILWRRMKSGSTIIPT